MSDTKNFELMRAGNTLTKMSFDSKHDTGSEHEIFIFIALCEKTFCIPMDSSFCFDTISLGWSIVYI